MHIFEEHRRLREGISDRMLGTLTDAQDVVQDTYLKWSRVDVSAIENPRSWLVTVCSRLALDLLESARVRRETYIGPWLPEPFLDAPAPDAKLRIDDTVSLVMHERKPHGATTEIVTRWFNGVPGVLLYEAGRLVVALSVAIQSGRIHRIYALRNPDKLVAFDKRTA